MRVLQVAPFPRGAAFGGSQRATTVAERLEERGAEVGWAALAPQVPGRARRLMAVALREPAAVQYVRRCGDAPGGSWDVALAAHSYMAPQLERVSAAARVIDFHNLEWRHLHDVAALERPLRRAHLRVQAARMRRFEAGLLHTHPLALFASSSELAWAGDIGAAGERLLVPNLLPRAERTVADAAWSERSRRRRDDLLLYVGKLTFPPNVLSLERFLRDTWPAILAARPGVRLRIAGDCSAPTRAGLAAFDGVEVLGFVEDLRPSLAEAAAAVFPFDGSAGSSLRVLLFALAGLPAIGPAAAFRDFGDELGHVVSGRDGWIEAVRLCLDGGDLGERARAVSLVMHEDPAPWDALYATMRRVAGFAGEPKTVVTRV
jgi:hypothetical protein